MKWLDQRVGRLRSLDVYQHTAVPPELEFRLDSNENWLVPETVVRETLMASSDGVDTREYPAGAVGELTDAISKQVGVSSDSVVPCNGGDQAIDLVCSAFLREGDRATIVAPTFSMYGLRATVAGAQCVQVPMQPDFTLPVNRLLRKAGREGLIFICSPNNPTGNQFAREEVESVLDSFPGLVVLDEAYVEFADFSLSREVKKRRNLAVLRTFSKAYGMAGLRLGYLLASEDWAPHFLQKVQYPYPVSSVAASMALSLMANPARLGEWTSKVKVEREWLAKGLKEISGVTVPSSSANFLLVSLPVSSGSAQLALSAHGIAAKNLGRVLGLNDCLRVTVGTRKMNKSLIDALREVCLD